MNKLVSLQACFGKRLCMYLFVSLFSAAAQAQTQISGNTNSFDKPHPEVANLIAQNVEPAGVVFEIETLDSEALKTLVPYVVEQVKLVKHKFPDLDIAIVSHGTEEFALQNKSQEKYAGLHNTLSKLVADKGVSMHVCGAVAGLKKLGQEDFPDFVSYSESGLAQINDYKALDYKIIVINQLSNKQRKALFEKPNKYLH